MKLKVLELYEASSGEKLDKLQNMENILLEAVELFSPKDEADKLILLKLFQQIDIFIEGILETNEFSQDARLQKGYQQLQTAEAAVVFDKGIRRLQEVRKEIWSRIKHG